jgi:uncharacterized protein YgiB involved in biofilm formation
MKRSKAVALSLMSMSAVMLQACDEPEAEAQVYKDVRNCIDSGELSEQQCAALYQQAVTDHLRDSPRFASRDDCYAQYGANQCETVRTSSGGSIWMPLMVGFMASRMLDNATRSAGSPLYRSSSSSTGFRTGSGYDLKAGYGTKTKLPEWATQPTRSRTQTVSRGGFGSRSSGFGG